MMHGEGVYDSVHYNYKGEFEMDKKNGKGYLIVKKVDLFLKECERMIFLKKRQIKWSFKFLIKRILKNLWIK